MGENELVIDQTYRGNIWSSPRVQVHWRLYLTDMNDDPKNHVEAVDMIRSASEDDIVEVFITSPGGLVSIADMYVSAIGDSPARIITRAIGECCSAATSVFLAGHDRICDEGCYFMFHNVQMGAWGDSANIFASGNFYQKHFKDKYYKKMEEVLTTDELQELFERAGEIYLSSGEMTERLQKSPHCRDGELKGHTSSNWKQEEHLDVTMADGYSKKFKVDDLKPEDFDEYNLEEIFQIADKLGVSVVGYPRSEVLDILISSVKGKTGNE